MASIEMIRPYVEQQVAKIMGLESVKVDQDGDIPIRQGSAACFARLLDGPSGPMLRIFAPMLGDLKKSPELLERLNELNLAAPYVRFFWDAEQVFCSMDVLAESLDSGEIANALSAVAYSADHLDDALKNDFGGRRMFEEEDAPKPKSGGSAYL
jgi:hypothetical protein